MNSDGRSFLKHHTEALVKDVGVEAACTITGKSKATIGRYYSLHDEHAERFMPVDAVAQLEKEASYPHLTAALSELAGLSISRKTSNAPAPEHEGHVNEDIAMISQRFAMLMSAYADAIADNIITPTEARSMLAETLELQKVLVEMKMHLEVRSDA